jgi:hypothetical protein
MTNGRLVAMADSIAHCRSGNALSRQLLDAESQHTKHCIDHCWSVARLSVCIDLLVVVLLVDLYGTSTPHGMPLYTHTHTLSLSLSGILTRHAYTAVLPSTRSNLRIDRCSVEVDVHFDQCCDVHHLLYAVSVDGCHTKEYLRYIASSRGRLCFVVELDRWCRVHHLRKPTDGQAAAREDLCPITTDCLQEGMLRLLITNNAHCD